MLPHRLFLTCHGLGPTPACVSDSARRFWISTDVFERCLDTIAVIERSGRVEVGLTFDDGNESDFTVALPRLIERRRRATFFICAGRIGQPGYLDAEHVRELSGKGMAIGSHGFDHLRWPEIDGTQLDRELSGSKKLIEAVVGAPVTLASAPFGALDHRVVTAAATAGFKTLYASSGGFATGDTGLVPRNTLKADIVPERDLVRLATLRYRAWGGIYDTARRMKYGFY